MAMQQSLKALTLNAWFPPFVAKDIKNRVKRLPQVLASSGADLIALQEIWTPDIRQQIIARMAERGFAHAAFLEGRRGFVRGHFGNGLLIISRYPFVSKPTLTEFSNYTYHEEFFVRKGALHVQVHTPQGGVVDVFNAHLGAIRFDAGRQAYIEKDCHQHSIQAEQLVAFVNSQRSAKTCVLAMDFNLHVERWDPQAGDFVRGAIAEAYTNVCTRLRLTNTVGWTPPAEPCVTFDQENPYVKNNHFAGGPSEWLDHILVTENTPSFEVSTGHVVRDWHISDHYPVLATLLAKQTPAAAPATPANLVEEEVV